MKREMQFEDLFQETLADLYDTEKQIVAALPKMMAASSSEELTSALESHLEETREQVARLEKIFEGIAAQAGATTSLTMQALLSDGERLVADFARSPVLDAALIAAARKVEHYEIAAYTTAAGLAESLGQQDAFQLLQETLAEETDADALLAELAEAILTGDTGIALDVEEEDEEELSESES